MDNNVNVLDELNKGATMGMDAIKYVYDKVGDTVFKKVLDGEYRKYKEITDRIAVVPSWLDYQPKENEITITLDPGCAFGTGTHQTTQLCMKAIEKYLNSGDSMADIGTGSGILAICAKKFGASTVYGCDNDDTVIDVCIENAEINGIKDIVFELNTADKLNEKYNFICANILHNVLAEIMGDLKNIMKPNAKMVLMD